MQLIDLYTAAAAVAMKIELQSAAVAAAAYWLPIIVHRQLS